VSAPVNLGSGSPTGLPIQTWNPGSDVSRTRIPLNSSLTDASYDPINPIKMRSPLNLQ